MLTVQREEWMAEAACRGLDPDLFFPPRGDVAVSSEARAICNGIGERPPCPVRSECLDYALENRIHAGVWGGTSDRERRRIARIRRATGEL
jgi:WhiB family redox-sensing transcriptional regulator